MSVGIVGGGQLGRMLALAGYPLGIQCLFLDQAADTPAGQVAETLIGPLDDPALLRELATRSSVLSFDWENVSVSALRGALAGLKTRAAPPLRALATGQDRLAEKRLFERLGIPTTRYAAVGSGRALAAAMRRIGLPAVIKTRRMGYDGKGQRVVRTRAEAYAALEALGSTPLLYEEWISFEAEVSIIGARGRRGELAIYPLIRNYHRDGILRLSLAPWEDAPLERLARRYLRAVLAELHYVGVLAIEFFVRGRRLIANELAPRVHNSGHWTIEGAETSQFENHLRAICGLPLGASGARGHAAMINLIGEMPGARELLGFPGLHLHDYGKSARSGRKVGHCTLIEPDAARRNRRARQLVRQLYPALAAIP
jgi:5-(carboxyamino)imidazole ribonucleotide synthase